MNDRAFFVPQPTFNYYNHYAANRQINANRISMAANRIQMPRLVNNIKPVPIPIKVPVAVDRAVPIPIKVPIPVKIPVHVSSTPYPYRQTPHQTKPSPSHYRTNVASSFFSPIPGMSKNMYTSNDFKTSTFKSTHGVNQFYTPHPFFSPAPNVGNAYTPAPYKTPNPFSNRTSNIGPNSFQIHSPTINKTPFQNSLNTSHMLKEMQKQIPSYYQKQLQEQMIRQAANSGTGMFTNVMDNIQKIYPYINGSNHTQASRVTNNLPAVEQSLPSSQNQVYEPAYSNRYPESNAKRDSKQENLVASMPSSSSTAAPSSQSQPSSIQSSAPQSSSINQPQTSTTKEEDKKSTKIDEKLLFKEPAYTELFQKISESNKLNEDIRSKIDYLYQSSMPKNNTTSKGALKKTLTISPIVNQLEGYESLDACTEKVKTHEFIIDNSNRNISMINDTIKDINHKIKKLKRTSRTRS